MSGYLVSDELPLSVMSSSPSNLCEMYSKEREPNYKYHQMKIWNDKEEKRKRKRTKGKEEREKCSREHTSSPSPLLTSHDSGVVESSTHACWPTELDHPSTIKDIKHRRRNAKEGERKKINESERGEVKTTYGRTLMEVMNLSSSLVVEGLPSRANR